MQSYTVSELCSILGATAHNVKNTDVVSNLSTDSRQPILPDTLFFALIGKNYNGHHFLPALEDGRKVVAVVSTPAHDYPHLLVDDTLFALQRLAAYHRRQYRGALVAITGSHGKTLTKELVAEMLLPSRRVYRSPGSYNSQVGVAISLIEMPLEIDVAIIEVGVSHAGDMSPLSRMVAPTHTILTSIGNAHLGGFGGDLDSIVFEKLKLVEKSKVAAIIPNTIIFDEKVVKHGSPTLFHVKQFGEYRDATPQRLIDYKAANITREVNNTFRFDIVTLVKEEGHYSTTEIANAEMHCPGEYNISNAVAAAGLAHLLGTPRVDIENALANFEPAPMRLEIHTTRSGIVILNDAYISDPTSARRAIDVLVHFASDRRSIAILGDMGQVGERSVPEHMILGKYAHRAGVKLIIAVGQYCDQILKGARDDGHPQDDLLMFRTIEALDQALPSLLQRNDVVLFKGRRALALEEAATKLLEPVAPTRLEVKLSAIFENIGAVREFIADDVKIMAIVKSYAYGSDATKISKALTRQNIDWFAVAYPDEAIPLRESGINEPILVMNVFAAEAEKFPKYNLTALVSDLETAKALSRSGKRAGKPIPIHLELDTGMNRLGMNVNEAPEIANKINQLRGVSITGVMTHFAAADNPTEDEFTRLQIFRFKRGADAVESITKKRLLRHAANTSATWRFPDAHFDMVRLGIGLYGISPSREVGRRADFLSALRFVTKVLRVHDVEVGESVGYNRAWRAKKPTRVATIAVGYNDGFHRYMSKEGTVLIHGVECPVVGSVCMDTCMVDVSHVDDVMIGDEVVLFGIQIYNDGADQVRNTLPIEVMAQKGDTIPYEILTGISARVRRILIEDDFFHS